MADFLYGKKNKNGGAQKKSTPPKPTSIQPERLVIQAKRNPKSLSPEQVLQLQRTYGNQAVGQLLNRTSNATIQRKPVSINQTGNQPVIQRKSFLANILSPILKGTIRDNLFGKNKERRSVKNGTTEQLNRFKVFGRVDDVEIASTDNNILRGRMYTPKDEDANGSGKNKVILFLSGSAGSAETYGEPVAEQYTRMGSKVLAINYRGFGGSGKRKYRNKKKKAQGGTPSEQGLYQDARAMYDYLVNQGYKSSQIVVHGFSLGGAVAAELVASLAEQGIRVGGLVMHSAMPNVKQPAMMGGVQEWQADVAQEIIGDFDVRQKFARLAGVKDFKDLPIHFMSGSRRDEDQLALSNTDLDVAAGNAGLTDVTAGRGEGGHENASKHFEFAQTQQAIQDILGDKR